MCVSVLFYFSSDVKSKVMSGHLSGVARDIRQFMQKLALNFFSLLAGEARGVGTPFW